MLHSPGRPINDDRPSARAHIDKPLLSQDFHRFTYRCSTNMKLLGQLTLSGQAISTMQLAVKNPFFDLLCYLLKDFDRLNRNVHVRSEERRVGKECRSR